jgi:hypothetical protein
MDQPQLASVPMSRSISNSIEYLSERENSELPGVFSKSTAFFALFAFFLVLSPTNFLSSNMNADNHAQRATFNGRVLLSMPEAYDQYSHALWPHAQVHQSFACDLLKFSSNYPQKGYGLNFLLWIFSFANSYLDCLDHVVIVHQSDSNSNLNINSPIISHHHSPIHFVNTTNPYRLVDTF